jgi:hypothetical protein
MRLMGPIFQVRSCGRSSNIFRNTHEHRPETTPAPKPLRYTMKTRSWSLRVRPAPATMSVVINLLDEHYNINKTCRKFAVLLLRYLTMTFWHTDRAVRGFSRALGWSLFKGIPSLFNDTARTIWNPQFEIVCGPDRKHTNSTCFSEAKKQKSRPSFWTCPSLFSGIKRDNNGNCRYCLFLFQKTDNYRYCLFLFQKTGPNQNRDPPSGLV